MFAIVSRVSLCLLLFLSCCTAQVTDTQPGCVDGDVRLVGGPNEFEGRVEICLDGLWGQVCGRGWQREDSEVVCRQLGYIRGDDTEQRGKAEASIGSRYGGASSSYVVSTVACTGSETRLENCSFTRLNTTSTNATCNFGLNALAVCTDPICFDSPQSVRLAGGDAMNEGRIEVCTEDGFRAALCAQGWNDRSAQTVCRELGLLQDGEPVLVNGNSTPRYFKFLNVSCSGMEESLSMCQNEIATSSELGCLPAAGVVCPGMFPETASTTTSTTIPATDAVTTTPSPTTEVNGSSTSNISTGDVPPVDDTPSETSPEPRTTVATVGGTDPSGDPLLSDTIIIILGIVGGLILLLLMGIMILLIVLVLVITLRKQKKPQEQLQNLKANGNGLHKDAEKILTNDLYSMTSEPELPKVPDTLRPYSSSSLSEEIHPYECAELEDIRSRARTGTFTSRRELTPTETSVGGSTPALVSPLVNNATSHSVPSVLRELTPAIPSELNSDSHVYTQPSSTAINGAVTDAQGYASLESPTSTTAYDTVVDVKKANPNCYILQPAPSQYQTPEPSEYQMPEYDKLVETPLPLVNTNKRENENEINSVLHSSTHNNQECDVVTERGGDGGTHDYDVPPVESPQSVEIMELGSNDQNPYAVLEHKIV